MCMNTIPGWYFSATRNSLTGYRWDCKCNWLLFIFALICIYRDNPSGAMGESCKAWPESSPGGERNTAETLPGWQLHTMVSTTVWSGYLILDLFVCFLRLLTMVLWYEVDTQFWICSCVFFICSQWYYSLWSGYPVLDLFMCFLHLLTMVLQYEVDTQF